MLFGEFTIVDAMYAPVVLRFKTYGVKLDSISRQYVDSVLALPAMRDWIEAGKSEKDTILQFDL